MKTKKPFNIIKESEDDLEEIKVNKSLLPCRRSMIKSWSPEELHEAVWPCHDLQKFIALLDKNPNELNNSHGLLQETLLHRAVRHGKFKIVEILLEKKADVNAIDGCGQTPLHIACDLKKVESVKVLLEHNANVDRPDSRGDLPIHLACRGGCLTILKILRDRHCQDLQCRGHLGNTFLHYAAKFGHKPLMQYLLDNGSDPNARNSLSETPLHLAAAFDNFKTGDEQMKLLVSHGANLHSITEWGDTPAHYATQFGSADGLKYLLENGVTMSKVSSAGSAAARLCSEHGLPETQAEEMQMSFLQKTARSGCIKKCTFILDSIMRTRRILFNNQAAQSPHKTTLVSHKELGMQEVEFKRMGDELVADMFRKNSPMKLLLKHAPDCIEHLLDSCIVSDYYTDQVQGKIFFDFFLFFPPVENNEFGELGLMETLINSRRERFLTHPLFETFLKLKWYCTWKIYIFVLLFNGLNAVAVHGYALTHFGRVFEEPLDPRQTSGWSVFLAITTAMLMAVSVFKSFWFFRYHMTKGFRTIKSKFNPVKSPGLVFSFFLSKSRFVAIPILSSFMLATSIDVEVRRYIAATNCIFVSISFMNMLSRLPKVGMYVFMLGKVMSTILTFLVTYLWHFLGYAIAFHIVMPVAVGDGSPFDTLGNSVIKVLTMMMGEYDFADNFSGNTHWYIKILFVVFVIDMSVVLMNLVLGLAVNDVDNILRDSKVRKMIHETYVVTYLENVCQHFLNLPWLKNSLPNLRITNSNTCQFKEVVYLDLVDIVQNGGNRIVIDRTVMGGKIQWHVCPAQITQAIVAIIKQRLPSDNQFNTKAEEVIQLLEDQKEDLQKRIGTLEEQMAALISMVGSVQGDVKSIANRFEIKQ